MKNIITYRGTVSSWHCDFNGYMNVQHYMGKFNEATWHFYAHFGITPSYIKAHNVGMFTVEQNINYFHELVAGDLVYIQTQMLEFKPKAIVFLHQMFNAENNELMAKARTVGVHINNTTRKSIPFTKTVLAKYELLSTEK